MELAAGECCDNLVPICLVCKKTYSLQTRSMCKVCLLREPNASISPFVFIGYYIIGIRWFDEYLNLELYMQQLLHWAQSFCRKNVSNLSRVACKVEIIKRFHEKVLEIYIDIMTHSQTSPSLRRHVVYPLIPLPEDYCYNILDYSSDYDSWDEVHPNFARLRKISLLSSEIILNWRNDTFASE